MDEKKRLAAIRKKMLLLKIEEAESHLDWLRIQLEHAEEELTEKV